MDKQQFFGYKRFQDNSEFCQDEEALAFCNDLLQRKESERKQIEESMKENGKKMEVDDIGELGMHSNDGQVPQKIWNSGKRGFGVDDIPSVEMDTNDGQVPQKEWNSGKHGFGLDGIGGVKIESNDGQDPQKELNRGKHGCGVTQVKVGWIHPPTCIRVEDKRKPKGSKARLVAIIKGRNAVSEFEEDEDEKDEGQRKDVLAAIIGKQSVALKNPQEWAKYNKEEQCLPVIVAVGECPLKDFYKKTRTASGNGINPLDSVGSANSRGVMQKRVKKIIMDQLHSRVLSDLYTSSIARNGGIVKDLSSNPKYEDNRESCLFFSAMMILIILLSIAVVAISYQHFSMI